MKAKKEAKRLVDIFMPLASGGIEDSVYQIKEGAKQCASKCVDEIIEVLNNYSADTDSVTLQITEAYFKELESVKQEIKDL